MPSDRHRCTLRLLLGGISLAALAVLFLSLVPTVRYVPTCDPSLPMRIEGPLRARYLYLITKVFDAEDVFYVRRGGYVYLRYFGFFDGNDRLGREEVLWEFQWQVASAIAEGVTIDDVYLPPPPRLMELVDATDNWPGPYPRRNGRGERIEGPDPRFKSCRLMRAAIIDDDPY